ncbi:MAG: methyl-accepting chemotaxis protein [Rhizomicrobium sp.]
MTQSALNFDRENRLKFAHVTGTMSELMREFWRKAEPHLSRILDDFYTQLINEPQLSQKLGGRNTSGLKSAQSVHWGRLFQGTFDATYMESVYKIGLAHKHIGLEPRWYIGGYKLVLNELVAIAVKEYRWQPGKLAQIISAINTAVMLDIDLAITAYQDAMHRDTQQQIDIANRGIAAIGEGLGALAKGDLVYRVTAEVEGQFIKLRDDFNGAVGRLDDAMKTAIASFNAIGRSQAVIEFNMDGTIISANENFLQAMGYTANDIVGKHHSMFVEPDYSRSGEYRQFWDRLNRGEFIAEKFKRIGRGGKVVWIQASYNPLMDRNGKPFKVIKFAADITQIENDRDAAEKERAARAAEQAKVVSGLASGLKNLSAGDLTKRIDDPFSGEYEQLRQDFNDTLNRLQETMKSVLTSTSGISTGAGEISQAADDLSKRTEQQAASLEETAAALEQITVTVKKTAQNAKDASQIVSNAKQAAESSGRVVDTAIQAMSEIEQSSKHITDIISVIDEIAFQTNLLALNAGVEAARAGDAGRGFAVVASEVRALAQRSSEAAKEIKGLIKQSGEHVGKGVRFVSETGEALKQIAEQVINIDALVGEIAQAAQQQSTGVEEVNIAVGQMDQMTQQNAAMVEESTAASRNLANETDELAQMMAFFKTGEVKNAGARAHAGAGAKSHASAPAKAPRGSEIERKPVQAARAPRTAGNLALSNPQEDWSEF